MNAKAKRTPKPVIVENADGTIDLNLPESIVRAMSMPEPSPEEKVKLMRGLIGADLYDLLSGRKP